jgi:hypothetical protein
MIKSRQKSAQPSPSITALYVMRHHKKHPTPGNPVTADMQTVKLSPHMIDKSQVLRFLQETLQFSGTEEQLQVLHHGSIHLPDSTIKCLISNTGGEDYFMLISAVNSPDAIARAVKNICDIKARLTTDFAATLLSPLATGNIDGRSCAVWPRHEPFIPSNSLFFGLFFKLRRMLHRSSFLDWAFDLCAHTLSGPLDAERIDSGFIQPLRQIETNPIFSEAMRQDAHIAIQRIQNQQWRPMHCVQHDDLWYGNFLFPIRRNQQDHAKFYVIDWGGAMLNGYPVLDFTRLAIAMECNARSASPHIDRLRKLLDCERIDIAFYVLCAFGEMATRLEHFPEQQFNLLATSTYNAIRDMALDKKASLSGY